MANRKQFEAKPGVTLLDAAGTAGLVLEHSCRTGRCGTCKARVRSGSTALVKRNDCLGPEERRAGWVLTCATAALSDVELEIVDLGIFEPFPVRTLPCRIDALERPADGVMQVTLRLPREVRLQYLPGQSIDVIRAGIKRSYSIANAPQPDARLELHVREIDAGVLSAYWFGHARVGDLLHLEGPRGTFFLRDVAGRDLVVLVTGTGIAPLKAMLSQLAAEPGEAQPRSIALYWGARRPADLYADPRAFHPALRYVPVLSRADAGWHGERGHVHEALLRDGVDPACAVVYACGSRQMVDAARAALAAVGLASPCFVADAFVPSSPTPRGEHGEAS
nr:2Fe-2S iron-sulfur cluster-binding protein [Schlegelella koreensis]